MIKMVKIIRGPLIVAHGDMDGIASAVLQAGLLNISPEDLMVVFCQPFTVDKIKIPEDVEQVYVVDIAVNNRDPQMTERFIENLGDKLAVWTDHHQGWPEKYKNVKNWHFYIREDVGACANLFAGKSHFAVKDAIVADAVAADTRTGTLSPRSQLIEQACKANMSDDSIRVAAVKWLLGDESQKVTLEAAAAKYAAIQKETQRLAATYTVDGKVATVDARSSHEHDLTQLLLAGQKLAEFAIAKVTDPRSKEERITIATQSKVDLVKLFGLPSGAPFRISLEVARFPEVLEKLNSE